MVIDDKRTLYRLIFKGQYNSLCRKACKATLFDGRDYSEYYNVRLAEDLLQSLEILENTSKVVVIDKILYNYTQNPQSIMHTFKLDLNRFEDALLPLEKTIQFLERENVFTFEDFKDIYTSRMILFVSMVRQICYYPCKTKDKVALFKKTESRDLYKKLKRAYKENMLKKCKQRFLFGFYTKGFYRTYIYAIRLYAAVCKLIRR